jgi:hypothetical protein
LLAGTRRLWWNWRHLAKGRGHADRHGHRRSHAEELGWHRCVGHR